MEPQIEPSAAQVRVRRVSFGSVTTHTHELQLDGSKMTSDGFAPVGLGAHLGSTSVALDEHEAARPLREPSQIPLPDRRAHCQSVYALSAVPRAEVKMHSAVKSSSRCSSSRSHSLGRAQRGQ